MKKSYIITGAILLLAIIVTVFALVRGGKTPGTEDVTTTDPYEFVDTQSYLDIAKRQVDVKYPVMESDIEGIYYTIDTSGNVQFYKYDDYFLNPIDATGSFDLSVTCSEQEIPATVHYYMSGEKITGFGLFTTQISDASISIYEYAFFKIMNLPTDFSKSNNYLLLVDTDKDNLYKNERIYDEPFYYNTSTGATSRFLDEENRQADMRGAKRADHSMLTDEVIKDNTGQMLFFSSRHYHLSGEGHKLDIFESGDKGHNNIDNYRLITDVADYYAKNTDDGGVLYLRNTENGFQLILHDGRKTDSDEEVVREFTGSYSGDYIRYGSYLLHKSTNTVYNLETNQETTLELTESSDFKTDLFAVNPETGEVFMRGFSQNCAAIALSSLANPSAKVFYNKMFLNIIDPLPTSDGSFILSVSNDDKGTAYQYLIIHK